jgi:hypothetical protein
MWVFPGLGVLQVVAVCVLPIIQRLALLSVSSEFSEIKDLPENY